MFWQIEISKEDQQYHGVIYKGETYVFTRVGFGNKSSPPIAELSMIKIAYSGKDSHPLAYRSLINNRYMDDIIEADNDEKKLLETRNQITDLIGKFGFNIKTWYSNNAEVGDVVVKKKILGLTWEIDEDLLLPTIGCSNREKVTKRKMLSRLSEVWDPLGICAGVLLTGKLLFQAAVRLKLGWDESVSNHEDLI